MSKRPSYAMRMRRAVAEAAQLHDAAYKDPMAMDMIATNYQVDRGEFERLTMIEVKHRLEDYALQFPGETP